MEGHLFEFAILLAVLGVAAGVSLALRLPVVPLYIVAGLVLPASGVQGPTEIIEFLGTLGVVFLLFSMGLEFSVGSLARAPERFAGAGSMDLLLNFPVGLLAGQLLGWSWLESFFLAGIVYMSSSAVVAKCIADFGRAARPETETILGIMVFEDLVIAAYLVVLNTVIAGGESGLLGVGGALLRAMAFIGLLFVLARRYQAPLARLLASRSEEAFTLALFAFVLGVASTAALIGLSDAVGAFLAGLVIGATDLKSRAATTLLPFQTLFAALFFVSFGMSLELGNLADVLVPAMLLVAAGIVSKTVGGFLAGRVAGHSARPAFVVGVSLVPKGEFSVVIAGLASAVASPQSAIAALTGVYVLALSVIGPIGMREADRVRDWLFPAQPRRRAKPQSGDHSPGA